jgi:hypothetical protein
MRAPQILTRVSRAPCPRAPVQPSGEGGELLTGHAVVSNPVGQTHAPVSAGAVVRSAMRSQESTHYVCVSKATIRQRCEKTSREVDSLEPGTVIEVLELRQTRSQGTRVRFSSGWVSMHGQRGPLLQPWAIVMSCPEDGTLDRYPDRHSKFDQPVMDKVVQLQQRGFLKIGFDRKGSSTAVEGDKPLFEKGDPESIRKTMWFNGYKSSAKAIVKVECQGFHGLLEVVCIEGGPITRIEADEMARILADAEADARMSGVQCWTKLTRLSYFDFLARYEPTSTMVALASGASLTE